MEYEAQAQQYRDKIEKMEEEFKQILDDKETQLQAVNEKLDKSNRDFQKKLVAERQKREGVKMQMELEERDANMKDVRLEFILNNQKKMQAQQKFLQQQLDKDLR